MTSLLGLVSPPAAVIHVVLFTFSSTTEPHVVTKCMRDFLALEKECLRDGKTYIQSVRAGRECSIEGKAGGVSHVIVVRFKTAGDRDYYIRHDPVHRGFVNVGSPPNFSYCWFFDMTGC